MEAANRGAREAGAPTIGFNIKLPEEQEPNPYTTPALTFQFHYFAMRKMHLAMRAQALVVFPGGFGTLDELFEILTLRQTKKARLFPIVLFDEAYWRSVINFERWSSTAWSMPPISTSSASPKAPRRLGRAGGARRRRGGGGRRRFGAGYVTDAPQLERDSEFSRAIAPRLCYQPPPSRT